MAENFNKQLLEELCKESTETYEKVCLISNEILESSPVKLICGHEFNYQSIYNEIKQQKSKRKSLDTCRLKRYQIKCPYCRNVQDGVIPSKNEYVDIDGVNYPPKRVSKNNKCTSILKSGQNVGKSCGKKSTYDLCNTHIRQSTRQSTEQSTKCSAIIKNGNRKGSKCDCICKLNFNLCGRHNKDNNIVV